ncbi:MAG: peptidylprolyl isomerase [Pirellulales bacterium]
MSRRNPLAAAAECCQKNCRLYQHAFLGMLAVVLISVAGCSSGGGSESAGESSRESASNRDTMRYPEHPVVEIDTNAGVIRVKLDAVNAPYTVRNFLDYVSNGFYDNTLIHYVAADKMILGGGYAVDRQPKLVGAAVRNEAHNGLKNVRGTIAMARDAAAGIDSATTQFFLNLADSPNFDHRGDGPEEYGYCVFGEVVEGLDVADEISRSATDDHGGDLALTPVPPVVVKSIRVVE